MRAREVVMMEDPAMKLTRPASHVPHGRSPIPISHGILAKNLLLRFEVTES